MSYFKYKNKNVFFNEVGNGEPLLLLHGNTVSSKMFSHIIELYKNDFKVILIDFLGHGQSDRIDEFPIDFWFDEAMQAIELLNVNKYGKVNIIGTSGGALVALNIALENGDLVNKVIADSFEGEKGLSIVADTIVNDRKKAKAEHGAVEFWQYNHGSDWESVVNNDTDVIVKHHNSIKNFFHKDLSQLNVPVLLSASLEDEFAEFFDFNKTYNAMASKIPKCKVHFFQTGGHPAMLSNAKEFSSIARKFFTD